MKIKCQKFLVKIMQLMMEHALEIIFILKIFVERYILVLKKSKKKIKEIINLEIAKGIPI